MIAPEITAKLGTPVDINLGRPLQALDLSGRARALATIVESVGRAKKSGLAPEELNAAATLVNCGSGDGAA